MPQRRVVQTTCVRRLINTALCSARMMPQLAIMMLCGCLHESVLCCGQNTLQRHKVQRIERVPLNAGRLHHSARRGGCPNSCRSASRIHERHVLPAVNTGCWVTLRQSSTRSDMAILGVWDQHEQKCRKMQQNTAKNAEKDVRFHFIIVLFRHLDTTLDKSFRSGLSRLQKFPHSERSASPKCCHWPWGYIRTMRMLLTKS